MLLFENRNKPCISNSNYKNILKVLGASIHEELIELPKETKFSVFIDETTDCTCKKVLAIVVRFYNKSLLKFETRLFALIEPIGCDAESLYTAMEQAFVKHGIGFRKNCIGFASDNTNVMVGEHNSVWSRLRSFIPHITLFGCICHQAHLIASHASKSLPAKYEDFIRDVYTHFSNR